MTNTTVNIKQAVPFFWVGKMEASLQFYVEGLGFTMTNQWIENGRLRWCWLQRDGVALMLQEFWQDGQHQNLPTSKVGVGVSICFICDDALDLYKEFKSKGLETDMPFVGNGMWITSINDPDGYNLQFESYTTVPEETNYSD